MFFGLHSVIEGGHHLVFIIMWQTFVETKCLTGLPLKCCTGIIRLLSPAERENYIEIAFQPLWCWLAEVIYIVSVGDTSSILITHIA